MADTPEDIVQKTFWQPSPHTTEAERRPQWRTDPVTIAAACLLSRGELAHLERWLNETAGRAVMKTHRPDASTPRSALWKGIDTLTFHAWDGVRSNDFTAHIDMGGTSPSDPEGFVYRYAGGSLFMGSGDPDNRAGAISESVLLAASNAPMTELLPHPIFAGLKWQADQDPGVIPPAFGKGPGTPRTATTLKGPPVDVGLSKVPGTAFAKLVEQRRAAFVEAVLELNPMPEDDA